MYIWGPEVNSRDTHLEGQSWWRALVTTKLHSKTHRPLKLSQIMQDCVAQLLSSSTSERSWLIKIKRGRCRKKEAEKKQTDLMSTFSLEQ